MKRLLLSILALLLLTAAKPAPKPTPMPEIDVDTTRLVRLEGEVNEATRKQFIHDLQSMPGMEPIWILINSDGGYIEDGYQIENAMDAQAAPLKCIVEREAASMAAGILLHCGTKYIEPGSEVMFHTGSIKLQMMGDLERFEALNQVQHIVDYFDHMDRDNASRLGMSYDAYMKKIEKGNGWYMTSEQAVKAKVCDAVLNNWHSQEAAPPPAALSTNGLFNWPLLPPWPDPFQH